MRLHKIVMFFSAFPLLRGAIMGIFLSSSSCLFAQDKLFENYNLEPVLVNMSITNIDGQKAVSVIKDSPGSKPDNSRHMDNYNYLIGNIIYFWHRLGGPSA